MRSARGRTRALAAALAAALLASSCARTAAAEDAGCDGGEKCSAGLSEDSVLRVVLGDELNAHVKELGSHQNFEHMNQRVSFTPAWSAAGALLQEYMKDAGLDTWIDGMGNVHGRTPAAASEDAPALMLGSHYDTLTDGGIYDGLIATSMATSKRHLD